MPCLQPCLPSAAADAAETMLGRLVLVVESVESTNCVGLGYCWQQPAISLVAKHITDR